jgi:hypothetical protein
MEEIVQADQSGNTSRPTHSGVHIFFIPILFANCTNASTFSKWCDGRRGRERGAHQHPSVIKGVKPCVEVGSRNTCKLTN